MKKEDSLTDKEIWKDIKGYEGLYKISNNGRIRRYNNSSKKYKRIPPFHYIKNHIDKNGYYRVILSKNNEVKNYLLHRLIAETFISNPKNLPEVNHKDEIKTNNNIDNLEWCTKSYNCSYGTRTKRIAEKMKIINKGKHYSIKTEFKKGQNAKKIINITTNKVYNSMQEAMNDTKIPISNLCNCCKGKLKTAGGFIWRYY